MKHKRSPGAEDTARGAGDLAEVASNTPLITPPTDESKAPLTAEEYRRQHGRSLPSEEELAWFDDYVEAYFEWLNGGEPWWLSDAADFERWRRKTRRA